MPALVRIGKSAQESNVGGVQGFEFGDTALAAHGAVGRADNMLVMECEATVANASGSSVTALTLAQRKLFLNVHTLDLRFDGDETGAVRTTEDGDNPLHPYQKTPFMDVERVNRRLLEMTVKGLTDSSTGLAKTFASGTNTLKYTVFASLGRQAFLDEASLRCFGVGPDQWRLARIQVSVISEYLTTVNANLSLSKLKVTYSTVRAKAKGRRVSVVPMYREYTPPAPRQDVRTTRGVVVDAVDENAALASNALGSLTVMLGEALVNKPPQTATDIHNTYLLNDDVDTAMEGTIADDVTPIVETALTDLASLQAGPLTAVQETYGVQWKLGATLLPSPRERELVPYLARIAKVSLREGQTYHFVNTAMLEEMALEPNKLPVAGVTAFLTTEPEAAKTPGLRIDKDGEASVFIPGDMLDDAGADYAAAKLDRTGGPTGNVTRMEGAVNTIAMWVPGTVDDEEKGLPQGTQGGAETNTYRAVQLKVEQRSRGIA